MFLISLVATLWSSFASLFICMFLVIPEWPKVLSIFKSLNMFVFNCLQTLGKWSLSKPQRVQCVRRKILIPKTSPLLWWGWWNISVFILENIYLWVYFDLDDIFVLVVNIYPNKCVKWENACQWQRKANCLDEKNYWILSWVPLREQKLLVQLFFTQVMLWRSTLLYMQLSGAACTFAQDAISPLRVHKRKKGHSNSSPG